VPTGSPPFRSFPEAVACALRGLRHAAQTQRHFRAQLIIAASTLFFAVWAGVPPVELALLAVTTAAVLGAELLNTAVETLTDLLHPDYSPAAAAVKDVAAGAALGAAVLALAVGLLVLLPRVIRLPSATFATVPLGLGLLCLVLLVIGAMPRRGSSRP
jgi:diacylglycerol kinase (ATP)